LHKYWAGRAVLAFVLATTCLAAGSRSLADHGVFKVFQDGQEIGSERFAVQQSGATTVVRSAIDYQIAEHRVRQESELNLLSEADLESYVWREGKAKITVDYRNGRVVSHYQPESGAARDFEYVMPSSTAIVDSNFYIDWQLLADRYDVAAGGAQQFRVFVPHSGDPDTVTISSAGTDSASGSPLLHLKATTDAATLDLYMEGHKLVRLEGPSLVVERAR
jgi:hypothetical protein